MPRTQSEHLHLPHISFDNNKYLKSIYLLRVLRDFKNKLIYFFIPLFLFELAPRINWLDFLKLSDFHLGILLIAYYYAVFRLIILLSSIPVGKIIARAGYKTAFIIDGILYLVAIALLYQAIKYPILILLAPIFDGLNSTFFYNSYHTILSQNASVNKAGKDLGVLNFLLGLAALVSPALGGFIVVKLGYSQLFILGIIISALSILASFLVKNKKIKDRVSWKEFRRWTKKQSYFRLSLSFSGRYIHECVITLWPLYVFILLGSIDKVGYLYSVSIALSILLAYFIGSYIDKHKKRGSFMLSGGLMSLVWFMRTQVVAPFAIALTDTVGRLTGGFHWMFFDRTWILRGKGKQALSYFVYREIIISIAAIIFWIVFAVIMLTMPSGWQSLFLLAAVAILFTLLVEEHQ